MDPLNTPAENPCDQPGNFWDIKPRQLVLIAGSFACGISFVVAQVDWVYVLLVFVALAALRIFEIDSKRLLMVALCFACGLLDAELKSPKPPENDVSHFAGTVVDLDGTIIDVEHLPPPRVMRMIVNCHSARHPGSIGFQPGPRAPSTGRIQVILYPGVHTYPLELAAADHISIRGKISALSESPKLSRLRMMLARKSIFCQLKTNTDCIKLLPVTSNAPRDPIESSADFWRSSMVAFHCRVLGNDDGSLLASMVLGDRAVSLDKGISDSFRASGLSHILAASGFNLSIVAGSIYFILRFCIGDLWISNSICLGGMLIYVIIAGPSPSVLRAFLMGALLLLSRCLGRKLHMPAALTLVMFIVLLLDPWSAADLGFQLSYFSTAGMILGATQACEFFSRNFRRCPEWIRSVLAATLVAQSCVLPLQLYYFKQFTPYCLIANIIVSPLVAPLTVLGFASSLVYVVEASCHFSNFVSGGLDKICYFPLELMRREVAFMAALPMAQVNTGQAQIAAVIFYYGVLLLFPLLRMQSKLKLWFLLFIMSLITMICTVAES